MSPPSVPPQAPSSDRPLPSAGSPGGSAPTSSVPSADSDFSPPLAPRFVSFARHYHRFALFRSPGAGRFPVGLDHFYRGARAASLRWRRRDPRFLDDPCVHAPLSDPGGPPPPRPLQGRRWCLPRSRPRRLRHAPISGLHHAACTPSVYASKPGSPPDNATLDSGWWPALAGQVSHLLGRIDGLPSCLSVYMASSGRALARAPVGGGFPAPPFRLRGGFTVPP